MNIYESCPEFEGENFLIRLFRKEDCGDLLKVYSDKNALPFFNSDNCDGDNFYYATKHQMEEALNFWEYSYKNGWFARLSIVEKSSQCVIGTVELCKRTSDDAFNDMGILRVDVSSDFEKQDILYEIFSLVVPKTDELLDCDGVITKVPIYAVERIPAIQKAGFSKSEHLLVAKNGYAYDGYWVKK